MRVRALFVEPDDASSTAPVFMLVGATVNVIEIARKNSLDGASLWVNLIGFPFSE